jgi:hypothetical protein
MRFLRVAILSALILMSLSGSCLQQPSSTNPSPQDTKATQNYEKWMKDSLEEANKHFNPPLNYARCRSDTQRWTTDPFDKDDSRNRLGGILMQVNGQFRTMLSITPHVSIAERVDRIYEMAVCEQTDSDFEKQFSTYTLMGRQYEVEKNSRYLGFILKHNLHDQFLKEDAEENK